MKFPTLTAWLDWQAGLHFTAIELGLDRVSQVWQKLNTPLSSKVITVAGTNGKGSSVAFLESIYLAAGYQTGTYTSPHLHRYNERIRLNGEEASDHAICEAFQAIEDARGDISLTYFEYGTLASLWLFAHLAPDIVILEVGLGGRLDAVNIIDADVALITSIGLDHQDWLGDDIETIGREKAGIMRAACPAIYASPEMPQSIADYAEEISANLYRSGADFSYELLQDGWNWRFNGVARHSLPIPIMRGKHQLQNAAGALTAIEMLSGELAVDQKAIRAGLLEARVSGRFERSRHVCEWVFDVAHNPQAAEVLSDSLGDQFVAGDNHAVIGMLSDKDFAGVLSLVKKRIDVWHVLDLSSQPRGLSAEELARHIQDLDSKAQVHQYAATGILLEKLIQNLEEKDRVVVFGSFLTVAYVQQGLAALG